MKWNTHQDTENRAYASILTTLFPEQTKTIPRIIVWSFIFLLDLILVIAGAAHFGLLQFENYNSMRDMTLPGILVLAVLFGIFWLQGVIWGAIVKFFQKRKELG